MSTTSPSRSCSACGARLAHDHDDTLCSPCRRARIEQAAHREALIARDKEAIKRTFEESGLYGVAARISCTPVDALDVLIRARILPFASARRRHVLERIVEASRAPHVTLAKELNISRWTVASYRRQLGIERGAVPVRPQG